jgi:nucleotide-binding universal stress UspA family protein
MLARVPVLVVPRRQDVNTSSPFSHLAVAVNFSAGSDRAIEHALALAGAASERVTLLHVVAGSSSNAPSLSHNIGIVEYQEQLLHEAQAQLVHDAHRRLQQTAASTIDSDISVRTGVLVGDTAAALSQAVRNIGADLLVVGVSARGIVSRLLFGTTAVRLLRTSRVPVLASPDVAMVSSHQASRRLAA